MKSKRIIMPCLFFRGSSFYTSLERLKRLVCYVALSTLLVGLGFVLDLKCDNLCTLVFQNFLEQHGIEIFTVSGTLIGVSHAVFALARTSSKEYKGILPRDLLDLPPLNSGNPIFGLLSVLAMLLCLSFNLYNTVFLFFSVNIYLLVKEYILVAKCTSETSLCDAFERTIYQKPNKTAKRAANRPRLYMSMMQNANIEFSFDCIFKYRGFDLSVEQLRIYAFLCMSYYEIFWDCDKGKNKYLFIESFRELLARYGSPLGIFRETNNSLFSKKIWKLLNIWILTLQKELGVDTSTPDSSRDLASELLEDLSNIVKNELFLPKRRVTMAILLHNANMNINHKQSKMI